MSSTPIHRSDLTTAGLNLIGQAVSIFDADLRLVLANRKMLDMFDLTRDLMQPGARFEDIIRHLVTNGEYGPVTDIEDAVRARVDLARAFEPHYIERTRANGRVISVEGTPLPQDGWVTVYTDITQIKRQEALLRARSEELSEQVLSYSEELSAMNREFAATNMALEETQRQLKDIEARTRLTTEMMPAHIAHLDLNRRYTYSNRRLSSVMPGRPSDILGRHIAGVMGSQAWARIEPHLNTAYCGTASVFEFNDDLSSRRIRVSFTPDNPGDEIVGVYILSMDVTEETQARAALQQSRRREIAAQMTSGLAHDFSNLLTIILGMQSKLRRMALPDGATELVDATLAASRRGGELLHRIGSMTGHRAPRPEAVDLAGFLSDLETLVTPNIAEGVTLVIRNRVPPAPILIDTGMLQDSLLNLLLNACDACAGQGTITLSAQVAGETWLEFTVTDTGPGFSDAALDHALDPFFTTKGGEGTGLGLAMVYDLTKLLGGEVRLSNSYTGARVRLRLPLRHAQPGQVPGLVLLVEDSLDIRASVRDMLTGMGYSVVEAGSVSEALSVAEGLPDITLILSDIGLQGPLTGIDLLDQLQHCSAKKALMTSLPSDHAYHQGGLARAPVLPKPFTTAQLAAFLQQEQST